MRYRNYDYDRFKNTKQGSLFIEDIAYCEKRKGRMWKCKCDCGKVVYLPTSKISSRKVLCCPDCGMKDAREKTIERSTKHGLYKHPLYPIWRAMIGRCRYKGDTNYNCYGGRGIDICKDWENDFSNFYNWAIENGYKAGLTIDRIDVNGNYTPDNCRWVPFFDQCRNRRTNVWITVDGVSKVQDDWAKLLNISRSTLWRLRKNGGSPENYIRNVCQKAGIELSSI